MIAISIDLGGTKIEGALVNDKGSILEKLRVPTEAYLGRDEVLENIESVISKLFSEKQRDVKGIGLSMPGFINNEGNVSFPGGTLDCLRGFNLKRHLEKKFNLPVIIENDANCFALAESVHGAGKNGKVIVGVIWGTGIGGGIIIDGKVFSGAGGAAGEFGHMVIEPSLSKGRKCSCGQYGCLENLASGSAISEIYQENGGKIRNANVREIYDSKEKVAKKTISSAIHYMAVGIADMVHILNPDVIVFGGGVSNLPKSVYDKIEKEVYKYTMKQINENLKIMKYEISDSAGVIGAAMLVFDRMKKY